MIKPTPARTDPQALNAVSGLLLKPKVVCRPETYFLNRKKRGPASGGTV